MNVIVSNHKKDLLNDLGIDIIKNVDGEFEVEQLINDFQNFYFQRMILDITSLKGYNDIKTLQKLSIALDMDKVILLLDGTDESNSSEYLSKLISMGIYNFTTTKEGILYLYNNPNSYRDVAHIHQLESVEVVQPRANDFSVNTAQGLRIIGVKNVTGNSGATTLIYMMKKQLEKNYKVVAIEVDKRDFMYFNDPDMISVVTSELGSIISKHNDCDIILVDVNKSVTAEGQCHDIVHLIEPSIIKLNKLMSSDAERLKHIKNQKVILNQSMLSKKDILDFEYEAKVKLFYNMPPLDDRKVDSHVLNTFLARLGFERQREKESDKKSGILGLFGH